jgi:hypothetical protein
VATEADDRDEAEEEKEDEAEEEEEEAGVATIAFTLRVRGTAVLGLGGADLRS